MIFQSMKMAWHAVVSNKLRSFLTMLGIIIGVVALIVLVSIANGATSSVTDQISSMGSSYLTVTITDDKGNPLRLKELSDFCEPEEVDEVAPVSWTSVTAKTSYSNGTMTLTGTTGSYADIQGLELFSGRFLKQTDIDNNSYVVVITKDTATELLGRVDAPPAGHDEDVQEAGNAVEHVMPAAVQGDAFRGHPRGAERAHGAFEVADHGNQDVDGHDHEREALEPFGFADLAPLVFECHEADAACGGRI